MIGVIICTHSLFAEGLKSAAEMIVGEQENLIAITFNNGDSIDLLVEKMTSASAEFESQSIPYVFLVDLFGASPFNAAMLSTVGKNTSIVSGVNLGFLLELLSQRDDFKDGSLEEFIASIIEDLGPIQQSKPFPLPE